MTAQLLVGYLVLWTTLLKALLSRAHVIPGQCTRCGQLFERRALGQRVCSCNRV